MHDVLRMRYSICKNKLCGRNAKTLALIVRKAAEVLRTFCTTQSPPASRLTKQLLWNGLIYSIKVCIDIFRENPCYAGYE